MRFEEAQALKKLLATVAEQGERIAALEKRLAQEQTKTITLKKAAHAKND